MHYVLNPDGSTSHVPLLEWADWFDKADRHVGDTTLRNSETGEEIRISTVFLGVDHNFEGGDPLLFESMIFGGDRDLECDRYATLEQAEAGHLAMVESISGPIFRRSGT